MTHILLTLQLWTELVDEGQPLDMVYLDFKKAFDSLPHTRFFQKVKAFGIDGNLLKWIHRSIPYLSAWVTVLSGIPQRSVLEPILFVNFITYLSDKVLSTVKIFADDTKMFNKILNVREPLPDASRLKPFWESSQ